MTLVTRPPPLRTAGSPDKQQLYTTRPPIGQSRAPFARLGRPFGPARRHLRPDHRRRPAALYRRSVRRDALGDRRLPALASTLVGVEPEQVGGLGAAGPADPRPLCCPPSGSLCVYARR